MDETDLYPLAEQWVRDCVVLTEPIRKRTVPYLLTPTLVVQGINAQNDHAVPKHLWPELLGAFEDAVFNVFGVKVNPNLSASTEHEIATPLLAGDPYNGLGAHWQGDEA